MTSRFRMTSVRPLPPRSRMNAVSGAGVHDSRRSAIDGHRRRAVRFVGLGRVPLWWSVRSPVPPWAWFLGLVSAMLTAPESQEPLGLHASPFVTRGRIAVRVKLQANVIAERCGCGKVDAEWSRATAAGRETVSFKDSGLRFCLGRPGRLQGRRLARLQRGCLSGLCVVFGLALHSWQEVVSISSTISRDSRETVLAAS